MTQFISEVSSNHHQDINRCLAFIDKSAAIGCDAVKFQLFKLRQLFAPEAIQANPQLAEREKWELPESFIPTLKERCDAQGIAFACTPFYLEAVSQLHPYVDFFKIASYELTWDALLSECGKTGKPLVLSTGMATLDEISHAVRVIRNSGCDDLTLLHCVSGYPTPIEEANLSVMETLREKFKCGVGWSDHSVSSEVLMRAIHRWDAAAVEFHLDLDGEGAEYSAGHCWLPEQIEPIIRSSRLSSRIDGNHTKTVAASEAADREWRADPTDGLRPFRSMRAKLDK